MKPIISITSVIIASFALERIHGHNFQGIKQSVRPSRIYEKEKIRDVVNFRGGGSSSDGSIQSIDLKSNTKKKKKRSKKRKRKPSSEDSIDFSSVKENGASESEMVDEDEAKKVAQDERHKLLGLVGSSIGTDFIKNEDGKGTIDSTQLVLKYFFNTQTFRLFGIQCVCSLFAVATGIASMFVIQTSLTSSHKLSTLLIQRCFLFAGIKYAIGLTISGLLLGDYVSEKGLNFSRIKAKETLFNDRKKDGNEATTKYLLYCFIISTLFDHNDAMNNQAVGVLMLGIILIREIANILWVLSDLVKLFECHENGMATLISPVLKVVVKLLTKSSNSDCPKQSQVSSGICRVTLIPELVVGAVIILNAIKAIVSSVLGANNSMTILSKMKAVACARLYLSFMNFGFGSEPQI